MKIRLLGVVILMCLGLVAVDVMRFRVPVRAQGQTVALAPALSEDGLAEATTQAVSFRLVGQVGGPTQAIAVQGHYAYVGVGLRLVVLDVSDPVAMQEVGSTAPSPYFVEDIVVSGTLAYVAAGGAGLRVPNVSNPVHPVEMGA